MNNISGLQFNNTYNKNKVSFKGMAELSETSKNFGKVAAETWKDVIKDDDKISGSEVVVGAGAAGVGATAAKALTNVKFLGTVGKRAAGEVTEKIVQNKRMTGRVLGHIENFAGKLGKIPRVGKFAQALVNNKLVKTSVAGVLGVGVFALLGLQVFTAVCQGTKMFKGTEK